MPTYSMTTRAKTGIIKPNPKYALFAVKDNYPEPKTVKTALKDPGWNNAMEEEMDTMHEVDAWDLVPPDDTQSLLGCRWD